ncbi:uncharacterized protein EV422DRAFT_202907 [Fimicolochytrium jonesii]|uniref:uncharacterized protein n=1 Tax=Fimicolochytrium jonesii TaxID=1396493 RepID=UPI0022FEFDCA|nr:uncharacterized protein EV422DRAFT_202907 [Fimicolochytrium jonesii]KAI8818020.1 hypothetical protein EV422DRAFT_202907 [Fimicolochytrium jonesii]
MIQTPSPRSSLPTEQSASVGGGQHRKRQSLACDGCRSKKRRCDGLKPTCTQCQRARSTNGEKAPCTYKTATMKRTVVRSQNKTTTATPATALMSDSSGESEIGYSAMMEVDSRPFERDAPLPTGQVGFFSVEKDLNDLLGVGGVGGAGTEVRTHATPPASTLNGQKDDAQLRILFGDITDRDSPELLSLFPNGSPDSIHTQSDRVSPVSASLPDSYFSLDGVDGPLAALKGSFDSLESSVDTAARTMSFDSMESAVELDTAARSLDPAAAALPVFAGAGALMTQTQMMPSMDSFNASRFPTFDNSRIFELGFNSDTLIFDPATFQTLNMDLSFTSLMMSSALPSPSPPLPDLETHLRDTGYVFGLVVQRGFESQADRVDPDIVSVMCASGAQFSVHPELERVYGSRHRAVKHFAERAERGLSSRVYYGPAKVQCMLNLGGIFFQLGDGPKACKWIREAVIVSEGYYRFLVPDRHQVPGNDTSSAQRPVWEILTACRTERCTESERNVYWETLVMCFMYDTYGMLASKCMPFMDEGNLTLLMYDKRPWENRGQYKARIAVEQQRAQMMYGQLNTSLSAFTVADTAGRVERLIQETMFNRSGGLALIAQGLMLLRTVYRLVRRAPEPKPDPDDDDTDPASPWTAPATAVFGAYKVNPTPDLLHETLINWWSSLPPQYRAFDNLTMFLSGSVPPAPNAPWTESLYSVECTTTFLLCLSVLHNYPPTAHFSSTHRITLRKPSSTPQNYPAQECRVDSRTLLTISRRAFAYTLRSLHSPLIPSPLSVPPTHATDISKIPFTPSHPVISPAIALFPLMGTAALQILLPDLCATTATPDLVREAIGDAAGVFLPVLDNTGRHFPVDAHYAEMIRMTVKGIVEAGQAVGGLDRWGSYRGAPGMPSVEGEGEGPWGGCAGNLGV